MTTQFERVSRGGVPVIGTERVLRIRYHIIRVDDRIGLPCRYSIISGNMTVLFQRASNAKNSRYFRNAQVQYDRLLNIRSSGEPQRLYEGEMDSQGKNLKSPKRTKESTYTCHGSRLVLTSFRCSSVRYKLPSQKYCPEPGFTTKLGTCIN